MYDQHNTQKRKCIEAEENDVDEELKAMQQDNNPIKNQVSSIMIPKVFTLYVLRNFKDCDTRKKGGIFSTWMFIT